MKINMSIDIQKRFLGLLKLSPSSEIPPVNGEILYSTNNVCVHPQGLMSTLPMHHNGFLTITAKVDAAYSTLLINWSPSNKSVPEPDGNNGALSDTKSDIVPIYNDENGTAAAIMEDGKGQRIKRSESSLTALTLPLEEVNSPAKENDDANTSPPQTAKSQQHLVVLNGHVFRPPKNQANSAFEIDLGEMRSLAVYFRNSECTRGEFVICSHDSVYKVLHFHFGGLDLLVKCLRDWKNITRQQSRNQKVHNLSIHSFTSVLSDLTPHECHPEEGLYRSLTKDTWSLSIDEFGRVQNGANIQKSVFFCGVDQEIRGEVWPYLLKYYKYDMTVLEKAEMRSKKLSKYEMINAKRENILQLQKTESFWRNVICSIEKDVLRTDRSKPFFKGEGNPNLDTLQRILLNYSVFTKTPYTQGMSDLLAPLLIEIQNENDIFWCFVGLMQQTIFISSPSDHDMEKQLLYLRELLRLFIPDFYDHLLTCGPGAMELLFAHRWILLCFKREFPEDEALRIWEACWAHYHNSYFHLFVCVAVIALYGRDITKYRLASDEILLHFTHLAMQMNGGLVLRKARGLLHSFRLRDWVPCMLCDLFTKQHDPHSTSHHHNRSHPRVKCTGADDCREGCIYGGTRDQVGIFKANMSKFFSAATHK